MESRKVIHVTLKDRAFNGRSEFYFGSVAAVYDTLDSSILGIKQNSLMQALWEKGGKYENKRCKVTTGEILRKASVRRKK